MRPDSWEDFFWAVVGGACLLTPITLTLAWVLYLNPRRRERGEEERG